MDSLKTHLLPVATALLLFLVVSVAYFAPQFGGEVLPQHDVMQYEGMSKDIADQREATGEDPQWTGGMFGGMPAYLINVAYPAQLIKNTVGQVVKVLDTPAAFMFFAMSAMWLMLLMFGVNPWVGIVASLAYGFSTYWLLIIGAGHITKMWAVVYAPLMMGGAWTTLRGNMWVGAAVTALAASLEIGANHPQITYYFLLAMAFMWLSEAVATWCKKGAHRKQFALRTALLVGAGLLAVGSNFSPLWYTARHTKDTIRGGSELAVTSEASTDGLALDYATAWSYGRAETINLLIPDFMGRDSGTSFSADGPVAATLDEYGLRGFAQQLPAYWGTQPMTGGPTYLGAAALFLAVLGIALARGRYTWWLVAASVLMILLAWGRNLMGFTEFMFAYLPGYNKFRTVSMTLVVVQWAVPLLGAVGLMRLWNGEIPRERVLRALAWVAGIMVGTCLLLTLFGDKLFDFGRDEGAAMMTEQFRLMFEQNDMREYIEQGAHIEMGEATGNAMALERFEMMRADGWRSMLMIVLAAAAVALLAWRRINKYVLVVVLGAVMLIDLVPVDLRFLSHESFVSARRRQITATAADKAIMADKTPGFRVLNLTVSPFNDATTSYFHRSVGGYHGAKLARYQDMIDRYLDPPRNEAVLDMLDTRYVIVAGADGQPQAMRRETANGPAWFVAGFAQAPSPRQEIDLLQQVDLKRTAVVAEKDMNAVAGLPNLPEQVTSKNMEAEAELPTEALEAPEQIGAISEQPRTIALTEYRPNYLRYAYESPVEAVAVFSEIYYDQGWTAYIDGAPAPYFHADYILRAMRLPAGSHTVEWRFRAPAWGAVEAVTLGASLVILFGCAAVVVGSIRKKKRSS